MCAKSQSQSKQRKEKEKKKKSSPSNYHVSKLTQKKKNKSNCQIKNKYMQFSSNLEAVNIKKGQNGEKKERDQPRNQNQQQP